MAYSILARELEHFRRFPRPDLIRYIGGPAIERTEWIGPEPMIIEIRVEWADAEVGVIRIQATLNGPSCWRLDRLEEAILVRPPAPQR
jgi:hypothetical protein